MIITLIKPVVGISPDRRSRLFQREDETQMKNTNRGISKKQLFKKLESTVGLTAKRNFVEHVWELSNGEKFQSLEAIASKYKL
jgi:hypothetical protein